MELLRAWENFYVIVGSSAAALTGLQFVVMTLVASAAVVGSAGTINAFGTPTVVHFSAALFISAILSIPWNTIWPPAVLLAGAGIAGLIYVLLVAYRARRQQEYRPVFEDWTFHVGLPAVAYIAVAASGGLLPRATYAGLLGVGSAALGLMFIGIHNAWDTVTYLVITRRRDSPGE